MTASCAGPPINGGSDVEGRYAEKGACDNTVKSVAGAYRALLGISLWQSIGDPGVAAALKDNEEIRPLSPNYLWQQYGACCLPESPVIRLGEVKN
jgi:hypothetical protein